MGGAQPRNPPAPRGPGLNGDEPFSTEPLEPIDLAGRRVSHAAPAAVDSQGHHASGTPSRHRVHWNYTRTSYKPQTEHEANKDFFAVLPVRHRNAPGPRYPPLRIVFRGPGRQSRTANSPACSPSGGNRPAKIRGRSYGTNTANDLPQHQGIESVHRHSRLP